MVALTVAALLMSGCSRAQETTPPAAPRVVTAQEAQLLATTRFRNFDAGSRSVTATIPVRGQQVRVDGFIDYATHTGYATASGPDFPPQLLRWNLRVVAVHAAAAGQTSAPTLPMPKDGWQTRNLDPTRSSLDTVLLVVANLGLDRPENPLLLQQGGALWLSEQDLAGRRLTVFAAPPTDKPNSTSASVDPNASGLRLWLDPTGLMYRAQVRVETGWVDVNFGDAAGRRLPTLSHTPPPGGS